MSYFTGIIDLDEKILNELDDKSLSQMCQVNEKVRSICNDDSFWRRRIYLIFGDDAKIILKAKKKYESYREFYTSKRFLDYKNKTYPLCLEIQNLPHNSQMVIDDFYNPESGFVNFAFTRDEVGITYLLLKIVYGRLLKDGNFLEAKKLEKTIDEQKLNIPDYRQESFNLETYNMTEKEKKLFLKTINIEMGRGPILKSVASRNSKFVKSLKNAPESFKVISTIHNGFLKGKIPFDIKWNELCTFRHLLKGLTY
jgi:hypothetical protein